MEQPRTHTSAATAASTSPTAAKATTVNSDSPPGSSSSSSSGTGATQTVTTSSSSRKSVPLPSSASMTKFHAEDEDIGLEGKGTNSVSEMRRPSRATRLRHHEEEEEEEEEETMMDINDNDENNANIAMEGMLRKDYIEAPSAISVAGGTVTPHDSQYMNADNDNDNEPTLFKQFDAKTGQFLRGEGGSRVLRSLKSTEQAFTNALRQQPFRINPSQTFDAASLKILVKGKFRSHSVPTISHSSLKRLANCNNHAHYHYHHQHPSMANEAGVKKKKISKNANVFHSGAVGQANLLTNKTGANDTRKENVVISAAEPERTPLFASLAPEVRDEASAATATTRSNPSLRKAILLCHQAPSSMPKYQDLTLDERAEYIKTATSPAPLPPINLQCLKEIDLQEIVKNPQLRHDIVFDPLLQFRPNLDGERGIKKRQLADKYWNDVENEIYVYSQKPKLFNYNTTRLVPLFNTLREVLLTVVPQREAHMINNVLDTELNVQELLKGSLIMTSLSEWLAQLFKHHCAPMRDSWVDKMSAKFREAENESALPKLIDGLRLVFQILEAMKLDIANHQIRILRTALLSNSVEFEKQYFQSLMTSNKINLKSSLAWFNKKFDESDSHDLFPKGKLSPQDIYKLCVRSIISLLSCRKMVREYPTSLSFDHARLILLRADIRQIVCLLICRLLFKQLVTNDTSIDKETRNYITSSYTTKRLKKEIVSIITDDHGNCRWTKNTMSIAIHLCKVISDLKGEYLKSRDLQDESVAGLTTTPTLDTAKIDFAKSWLSRQTQPLSEVYGVLENRVFKSLEESIIKRSGCTVDGRVKQDFIYLCSNVSGEGAADSVNCITGTSTAGADVMTPPGEGIKSLVGLQAKSMKNAQGPPPAIIRSQTPNSSLMSSDDDNRVFHGVEMDEFDNVYRHLYTVINFHWSVFGCHYLECVSDKMVNRASLV
ncbi:hypothetical protein HG536_0G02980 [Torulaspora globosa]|uniref:Uncharacterized protein n=1 Tax=Torulaspora globosa TaxID=48254 RepID=A0A7G3ZLQ0_9SACH|nr:uncharacterized protein HG536_0G02980 [Torulaspora globosa]QLL34436.1 hypothetical protein HG536_0G02980 [Torulaspora globosa]